MKTSLTMVLVVLLFSIASTEVRADYVLPYPSLMPGNKLYNISRLLDSAKSWWYWGRIAQVKYHLQLADKYLVEAKTLFEYKQYPLGLDALHRSDREFLALPRLLDQVSRENKDNTQLVAVVREASLAHGKILQKLAQDLPASFQWQDEHKPPSDLDIGHVLEGSIAIRSQVISTMAIP